MRDRTTFRSRCHATTHALNCANSHIARRAPPRHQPAPPARPRRAADGDRRHDGGQDPPRGATPTTTSTRTCSRRSASILRSRCATPASALVASAAAAPSPPLNARPTAERRARRQEDQAADLGHRGAGALPHDHAGVLPRRDGHPADLRRDEREHVEECAQLVRNIADNAPQTVNKILIGIKADMKPEMRQVSTAQGQSPADEYGMKPRDVGADRRQRRRGVPHARDRRQRPAARRRRRAGAERRDQRRAGARADGPKVGMLLIGFVLETRPTTPRGDLRRKPQSPTKRWPPSFAARRRP